MFHVKHRRSSISRGATSRMQPARTGSLATSPSAAIDRTAAAPSCRMSGGMFHVKHPRTTPAPETPGSQSPPARTASSLEICRPCPAARRIPGIQTAPIRETLQLSERTGGSERMFHVKHRRPSISRGATCRMQAAGTGPSATGPSATIDGTAAAPSCRMPGGMFHVKYPRTTPTPETSDHNRRPPERPHRWRSAARARRPGVSQRFERPPSASTPTVR